jgi:hypothetical protein
MATITVLCPYHGVPEELEIPESYAGFSEINFEGHIPCGCPRGPEYRAILEVKIANSKITHIKMFEQPTKRRVIGIDEGESGSSFKGFSFKGV